MLRDERLRAQFQKRLAAQGDTPLRPDLAGFTREVHEIHKMHVTLTHVLRALTRNMGIQLPAGPVYPAEQYAIEQGVVELADLDADIADAMKPLAMVRKRR